MRPRVEYFKDGPITWDQAKTLQDSIVSIRTTKGVHSPEYRALESFYGKERLEKVWSDHLLKKAIKGES